MKLNDNQNKNSHFDKVIKEISTKSLVDELSSREGTEKYIAEPYKRMDIAVEGPAIILKIID